MDLQLLEEIKQQNPWINNPKAAVLTEDFIPRQQLPELLDPEWDSLWTVLVGPRRAGKTTLGKALAHQLVQSGRYSQLLYLNCDFATIRSWLSSPLFISQAMDALDLNKAVILIDEVQRLENPGLLLKAVIDLGLPNKYIATGSSQLELRSKVQEFLTGRQLTSLVLPMSSMECPLEKELEEVFVYGSYPQVLKSRRKKTQIQEIYHRYIQKDIVEILKVGKPDVLQKLLTLIAHSSGQLVNLQRLATDCGVSVTMIKNHLAILEQTYVVTKLTPFVGNKRAEVCSNPIYYFVDNGFRGAALNNFLPLSARTDKGLMVESFIFQELLKIKVQCYLDYTIHYWRTKSGAEVDFILSKGDQQLLPVEVKAQNLDRPVIPRAYRSFLEAYQPEHAVIICNNLIEELQVGKSRVHFIPITYLDRLAELVKSVMLYRE